MFENFKMFENLEEVYKRRQQIEEERLRRLQTLYENRDKIRDKFFKNLIKSKSEVSAYYNFSVTGVDSAYTVEKGKHGGIEYFWVGVGSNIFFPFYAQDTDIPEGILEYLEDVLESNFLLSGIGSLIEFELTSKLGKMFKYVFLDGSFFTALLNVFRAYTMSINAKEKGQNTILTDYILKKYEEIEEELITLIEAGGLCAFPKRSSKNELVEYISKLINKTLTYRDAELVDIILEPGEYIDITSMINRNALSNFLADYKKIPVSDKLRKMLIDRLQIFYVKGAGGGVLRVEFFANNRFPIELIYSQNITDSNEVQVIVEADRIAKEYLKSVFFEEYDIFGNYRK